MDEYFLQYLWKFQKADQPLHTTDDQAITVFSPGFHNTNSGPDFLEARAKIGALTWSGSVEVHHRSSDWDRHGHQHDKAYDNVILHVVWVHDKVIQSNGKKIPTLELKDRVSTHLEEYYRAYINQPKVIRCADQLPEVPPVQVASMLDHALADRLKSKAQGVRHYLDLYGTDWEQATYHLLLRAFGFSINKDPMETLAGTLPFKIIRKCMSDHIQVHALLFGMAGLLPDHPQGDYAQRLTEEFSYLKSKYQLAPQLKSEHWKRARMRPSNFPTLRMAQLGALLSHHQHLFEHFIAFKDSKGSKAFFQPPMDTYWRAHYDFNKPAKRSTALGKSSIDILTINVVVPVLVAYAKYTDEVSFLERAQNILEDIKPESNHLTEQWDEAGIKPASASDSQALIHQYKTRCREKKCLQCNIGLYILHKA